MPPCCGCGEVVTFHVSSLLNYLLAKDCEEAVGVTEFSIRHYIKSVGIGCVGCQVKFRNGNGQVSAAHIRRNWFVESDIKELDACKYIFIYYMVHFKTIKIHKTVTSVARPAQTDGFIGWIEDTSQDQFRKMKREHNGHPAEILILNLML